MTGLHTSTQTVDGVFLFILAISVALFAGVITTMLYFVVRYSRSRNPDPENIPDNVLLEVVWVIVPLLIVLAMFFYGWKGFRIMRTVPPNSLEVQVYAAMWRWSFEYGNGKTTGELIVPAGRPVKLLIASRDVLHSLFIPAFRIKEDAVPGMQTYLWFLPDSEGSYDLFCSEYCGEGHSSMITKVKVISARDFQGWYEEGAAKKAATAGPDGMALLRGKGCLACHSNDGSRKIGPTFKGLFGSTVTVLTGDREREVIADEAYLRKSVLDPQADIVKGFPAVMPPEKDNVSPEELEAIVGAIKGLK